MEEKTEESQSVSSDLIRGHINTIILRALYDGDKYGYEIISEIERKSHGQYVMKQPSLYSALKRLEKDGFITSYWGGSVSGGRRKYFSLTDAGKDVSETNQAEWEYSRTVIDNLISDKDFDFSNPAPGAVNMRVLRDTTSRTPSRDEDFTDERRENGRDPVQSEQEWLEKQRELDEEAKKIADERSSFEENASRFEETRLAYEEEAAKFLQEKQKFEREMDARNDALLREREWREQEIAARERQLEEERKALTENLSSITAEERNALEERIRTQEEELALQNERYENLLSAREEEKQQTKQLYERLMEAREKEIIEEQESRFREREQELLHRNYVDLISTPPETQSSNDYDYFTAPVGDNPPDEPSAPLPEEDVLEYRPIVRKIFANSVKSETEKQPIAETRATSLDGIDFHDLEARAAQDGIKIYTAGGKSQTEIAENTASVVHKGKALFVSALLTFVFLVLLGSVLLGVSKNIALPVFYPYLIWAIGLAVLLIAGVAYANHFGERSLRRTTPAIVNAIVLYVLLVIVTLIFDLSFRIDFTSKRDLVSFVIVPVVFFFGVVVFGLTYYLLIRPKKF